MIDTLKTDFPADMVRAADSPAMGTMESMADDVVEWLKDYAREKPVNLALCALGVGFVLGWKLKPW